MVVVGARSKEPRGRRLLRFSVRMAAATLVGLWRVEGLHRFALFGERALPPFLIETVGTLIMFEGTEGNVAGAMR